VCNFIAIPITLREANIGYFIEVTISANSFDIKLLRDEPDRIDDRHDEVQGIEMLSEGTMLTT
jgi:hypothetical protein